MPRISSFYGILIYMYLDDHNPPHFHAFYNEYKVLIGINDFAILVGSLPPKAHALVIEWAIAHHQELKKNWQNMVEGKPFDKIEPLK